MNAGPNDPCRVDMDELAARMKRIKSNNYDDVRGSFNPHSNQQEVPTVQVTPVLLADQNANVADGVVNKDSLGGLEQQHGTTDSNSTSNDQNANLADANRSVLGDLEQQNGTNDLNSISNDSKQPNG